MSELKDQLIAQMQAAFERHSVDQIRRSFCLQDRDERKLRIATVMAMSVELERIRAVSIFATGLAESAIGDVIEGNWRQVADWIDHFSFTGENADLREQYVPLWANFRLILRGACAAARCREHNGEPS